MGKSKSSTVEATLWANGFTRIVGVDEAGRGAYAGPLVVAAVILDPDNPLAKVGDSKKFTPKVRAEIALEIRASALAVAVIEISPAEIDANGVHKANLAGMRRAIVEIGKCDYALTDGYAIEGVMVPTLAIWKGDQVSATVGAASIIAKTHRDQIMIESDLQFPGYGFADHKGYGTATHTAALKSKGVTSIHRRSFAPIAELLLNS
jgi:ribonuclease HII